MSITLDFDEATLESLPLKAGELALQLKAQLVLLDESAARLKAQQLAIPVTGVLGILRKARLSGAIASLKSELYRLRTEASFLLVLSLRKLS